MMKNCELVSFETLKAPSVDMFSDVITYANVLVVPAHDSA